MTFASRMIIATMMLMSASSLSTPMPHVDETTSTTHATDDDDPPTTSSARASRGWADLTHDERGILRREAVLAALGGHPSSDDDDVVVGPFSSPRQLRSFYYFHAGIESAARNALAMTESYSSSPSHSASNEKRTDGFVASGLAASLELVRMELREMMLAKEVETKEGEMLEERRASSLEDEASSSSSSSSSSKPPAGRRLSREERERLERRCRRDSRDSPRREDVDATAEDIGVVVSVSVDARDIVGEMRRRHLGAFSVVVDTDPPAAAAEGDDGSLTNPDLYIGLVTASSLRSVDRRDRRKDDGRIDVGDVDDRNVTTTMITQTDMETETSQKGGRRRRRLARYGLFASRNFEHGEAVHRSGQNVLFFQDDDDWGSYLASLLPEGYRDDDNDAIEDDRDDDDNEVDDPFSTTLACLAVEHSSRRRISRPGRHLIVLDIDEGMFVRRRGGGSSPDEEEEDGNVGIDMDGWGLDWLALRDIKAGEEIVESTTRIYRLGRNGSQAS